MMRREEFFQDAKARGKTKEEALAGADKYFKLYGEFDAEPSADFRPDLVLNENLTDNMPEEEKESFQQVTTPTDTAKYRAQRYFELKDGKSYADNNLLAQRARTELGTESSSDVDYVGVVKYLTDVTAPYAKMQQEKASAVDIAKGTGASFMETAGNFAKVALMTMAQRPAMSLFDKPEKGEISRATSEISKEIKGITPESWKEARELMQLESGRELKGNVLKKTIQGAKQGFMLVADNAPNLVASRTNPALGYSIMYSNEKESMYETLVDAGVDKSLAESYSTMYGSVSAPIEYVENAGRLTSAFGKKKVAGKGSALVRRVIKGKLKEAGINIAEELTQEGAFNLIYNAAVKSNNDEFGTSIENKNMTIEDAMKTAKASLQMSAVLEAIGVPVKFAQKRGDIRANSIKMTDAGISAVSAEKYAKDISQAESQNELDAIILEIQGETEQAESAMSEDRQARVDLVTGKGQELTFPDEDRTALINGGNGTPLTDSDFDAIKANNTDEGIAGMIGGDAGDVFLRAVNGDANARAEYNRLLIESQTIQEPDSSNPDAEVSQVDQKSTESDSLVNVAKEIVSQEVIPLIEDVEQEYVQKRLDGIIDEMSAEDAQIELKRLHEAYPDLPRSVDKFVMDAVNVRGDDVASTEDVITPEDETTGVAIDPTENLAQVQTTEEKQAVQEFIPEEQQATTEQVEESAKLRGEDDTVFINKAEIEKIRESEQFSKLSPSQKIEWQAHLDNAKKLGMDIEAINIAERVISSPRVITPVEHAAFVLRSAQLFNKSDEVLSEIEQSIITGKDTTELKKQLEQVNNQLDVITRAGDLSGTEAGRALNIRKMGIERKTYEIAEVVRQATAMKGKPLNDKELSSLQTLVNQLEEWDKTAERLISEIEKADTRTAKDLAGEVVSAEIDSIKGPRDIKRLKSEEKAIKAQLRKMGYRMNDITGATVEASALIAKLAVNYIKQGATNLDEVVSKVQSVMPEASEQNVYDALSGRHKDAKQRVRTESAKRLSELKTQARISSKIIDATNGIFTKSGVKKTSSPEVKRLLKELRELQRTAENTERSDLKLQKILAAIGKVELDIQQSNFPKKKGVINEEQRVKDAKSNLSELRRLLKTNEEIADMERRIKEKDYDGLFNPRTVKAIKSKELQDALIKKHQLKRDIRHKMYAMRKKSAKDYAVGTADFFRAIRATADMSYFLRQGIIPLAGHPVLGAKAMISATKSFFSQNSADSIDLALRADEMQLQRDKYGLFLSDMDDTINKREELFTSNLIHKIPLLGSIAKASERHMVIGLNMLRSGLFDDFIKKHPEASDATKRAYARYVNIMTGRGEMKGLTDSTAAQLMLFSPKFTASRIQAIPVAASTAIKHKELRGEIARQWVGFVGTGMAILALAKMAGLDVGDDPESPDFGKIIIGDKVRIDVWGGLQQPVRLFLRTAKVVAGKSDENVADISWQFIKYKFAPGITVGYETVTGKDWVTNKEIERGFNLAATATPLIFESAWEAYAEELSASETALALGGEFFGLGVQTYEKKKKANKSSVWN